MFIESLCRNWPPLFMMSHSSLLRVHSSPYLWRILMKFRDALNFSTEMVFIIISAGFFIVLIFTKSITLSSTTHWCILWNITSMLHLLVIHVIFRKMNSTLAIAINLNRILYDTDVSSNPLNHKASFDVSTAAMYSASVVERAIVPCNSAFQLVTH